MYLYNLTLQRATGITHAIHGNFSGTKQQEIIVSRGKLLELLRPDPNTGKVYTILSVEIFGVIRSLQGFRLTGMYMISCLAVSHDGNYYSNFCRDVILFDSGGNKDYLIVGTDSGRISIMEYVPAKNTFEKVRRLSAMVMVSFTVVSGQLYYSLSKFIPADSSRNLREVGMS